MPVVINELEVVEAADQATAPAKGAAPPAAPVVIEQDVARILRDAEGRELRRVAD
jgi:hypothetical protein